MAYSATTASTVVITGTAASGSAVTLTLAAPATGTFHYITHIEINHFRVAVLTAGTVPILVTSTNLNGNPTWDFPADVGLQGAITNRQISPSVPIKSAVSATATTIVAPATTSVIWRVTAFYYVGS